MTITNISWYLCVLFAVAMLVSGQVDWGPGWVAGRLDMKWLASSATFAALPVIFWWFRIPQPRWLLRLFQCVAVLATVVVLIMLIR